MGQSQGEVPGRAGLHDVMQVYVALPVPATIALLGLVKAGGRVKGVVRSPLGGLGTVDASAGDVAGHELQPRQAEGTEVKVVACLPGAFMGAVEIGVLDRIGQVDGIATNEVEGRVAVDFLIGEGERLGCKGVLARQAVGAVIDCACYGLAVVLGVVKVAVKQQPGLCPVQVGIVLTPGVAQFAGIKGTAKRMLFEQVGTDEFDTTLAGVRTVACEIALAGGRVLVLERGEVTGQQMQLIDLTAVDQQARGVLRLQAFVGRIEYRGLHGLFAKRQGGARNQQFQGATATCVVVFAVAILIQR